MTVSDRWVRHRLSGVDLSQNKNGLCLHNMTVITALHLTTGIRLTICGSQLRVFLCCCWWTNVMYSRSFYFLYTVTCALLSCHQLCLSNRTRFMSVNCQFIIIILTVIFLNFYCYISAIMCSIDAAVKHECFVCSINNVKHSIILLLLCSVFNAADFVTGLHADRVGVKCRLFLCYSYSVWTEHWNGLQ